MMLRSLRCALLLVWLFALPAWALDPAKHVSQYAHTAWRTQDGAFKGKPAAVAQGRDGYLWVGTASGLLRFDGVRFVPAPAALEQALPALQIEYLLAARDGSLWISTLGGLSRWKDDRLTTYPSGAGGASVILEDRHGTIWFTLNEPAPGSGPLCRVEDTAFRCFGPADGVPNFRSANAMREDSQGNLWIGGDTVLLRWSSGSHTEYRPNGLAKNLGQGGVTGIAPTPNGTIWVGIGKPGPGLGLQRVVGDRWTPYKTPEFDGSALSVSAVRLDGEGVLWVATNDRGLYRIHGDAVEHFDSTRGLSGNSVMDFTEDREGNLWVWTTNGLDRFSDTTVVAFGAVEGLCSTEVDSVLASRDGSIWSGGDRALSRVKDGRVSCMRTDAGLPGTQVTSLLEDHAGRLWVGLDTMLWVYDAGRFRRISKPDGSDIGFVSGIDEDASGSIWLAVGGTPRRLMRLDRMAVVEEYHDESLPRRVAADPTGGVWVGLVNGDLAHYDRGRLQTHRFAHDGAALLNQVLAEADGSVLAATNYGLIGWHAGKPLTLTAKNGLPCRSVTAITFDAEGNLWLFMDCALGQMTSHDVQQWMNHPDMRVSISTLDVFDGVQTGRTAFVAAARSADGRLWFANTVSLLMLDPARRRRNAVAPLVHIEQIIADRRSFPTSGPLRLPPRTRNVEIDYVGLSFTAPQKVQFRYRLEGLDDTWQEPGTRRQAFYNDLRPGRYRFRVIASNNDGLWNEDGAALDLTIVPAWYQTNAFWALCVLASALAMWTLYQLRVRQVARSLNARFDERLAERTRVAREIHDTLLQTVQGSRMVADNALHRPDDIDGMRHAMEQVSTWLGQASNEGRAAVSALRASTTETNDLAAAIDRAIEDCRRQAPIEATMSVTGSARDMHPVVRDEIYRMAYEAIRNACTHSGGSRLDVALTYGQDLVVRVTDNGVGLDPSFADAGKPGHYGLPGMRERAARIGAKLTIAGAPKGGTEVVIRVPGRVIFRTN